MKVALVSIFVDDPVEAFKFYTGVLGFKENLFIPEAMLAVIVSAEDPEGTAILLEPAESPLAKKYKEGLYEADLPVIVFGSKDINDEYVRLKGKGVKFRGKPVKNDFGTEVTFEDGFGNLIKLHQGL